MATLLFSSLAPAACERKEPPRAARPQPPSCPPAAAQLCHRRRCRDTGLAGLLHPLARGTGGRAGGTITQIRGHPAPVRVCSSFTGGLEPNPVPQESACLAACPPVPAHRHYGTAFPVTILTWPLQTWSVVPRPQMGAAGCSGQLPTHGNPPAQAQQSQGAGQASRLRHRQQALASSQFSQALLLSLKHGIASPAPLQMPWSHPRVLALPRYPATGSQSWERGHVVRLVLRGGRSLRSPPKPAREEHAGPSTDAQGTEQFSAASPGAT